MVSVLRQVLKDYEARRKKEKEEEANRILIYTCQPPPKTAHYEFNYWFAAFYRDVLKRAAEENKQGAIELFKKFAAVQHWTVVEPSFTKSRNYALVEGGFDKRGRPRKERV